LVGGAVQTVAGITNPAGGGTFSGFFGFVSDTAFTSISLGSGFTGSGELFDADNVRFVGTAVVTPAPEPATAALLGFGLIGVIAASAKRKLGR
jgi:hypothetical protein